jgi:integrase
MGVNPASATTPPRVAAPTITPPDRAGLARVLRRAGEESPELACYLLLAAATGARRSELVALRWPDVDLGAGSLSISRGIVFGPDGLVEKGTKTHSARRVSLDPRTVDALRDHRERMTVRAGTCRTVLAADAFVFSNAADCSEPWFPDSVSRSFKRLCVQEGMPDVRLHDLRHFVATQLLSAGVDVRTVAGRLGHRNAATSLKVYAHFLEEADRDGFMMRSGPDGSGSPPLRSWVPGYPVDERCESQRLRAAGSVHSSNNYNSPIDWENLYYRRGDGIAA